MNEFAGIGVAVVTPFHTDGTIDFPSLERVIEHVIQGGVDYLVALGSTGESATLDFGEQKQVLDFFIDINKNRKPIVAGNFAGNNTKELRERIQSYDFTGIDAILSSSPSYNRPSQEGIFHHFMEVEKVSSVPIIIYNVPSRTGSNIDWDTSVKIAKASKKFVGLKEATKDFVQATRIINNKPNHFVVVSGDDEVAFPMMAIGGDGVISVIANALPQNFTQMIHSAQAGDFKTARVLNTKSFPIHDLMYAEVNPTGIKSALQILGLSTNDVRIPLIKMSEDNYQNLKVGLDHFFANS